MGDSIETGVVNPFGQVFRRDAGGLYPNFYIMDGSSVPSALGVNSSLTIAALALRCAESMVAAPTKKGREFWPDWNLMQQTAALGSS